MRHLTKGRVLVLVGLLIVLALVGASDVAVLFLITGAFIDAAEAELRSGRVH